MERAVFNPGHYTHASGFEFTQDVFDRELRERTLAVISTYGIVSGFGYSDMSVPNNPRIKVSPGLAYDGQGNRVKLTQAQYSAGLTYIENLTSADEHKAFVVQNVASGTQYQAHPLIGELRPTKYVDVATLSVVATGSVNTKTQVRIGGFTTITEGVGAAVVGSNYWGRDIFTFPSTTPYIIVGPAGDLSADYQGDDATPFNAAFAELASSGGGTVVIRSGTYTIDPANPIVTENFTSINVIGVGREATIECYGPTFAPHWFVTDCDEFNLEGVHLRNTVGAAIALKRVERFRFGGNRMYCNGTSYAYLGVHFVSGVTWATIEQNEFLGTDSPPFTFRALPALGAGCRHLHIRDNYFNSVSVALNGEIANVVCTNNHFDNLCYLTIGRDYSYLGYSYTQPRRGVFNNNTIDGMIRCAATGMVFAGNSFYIPSARSWGHCSVEFVPRVISPDYNVLVGNTVQDMRAALTTTLVTPGVFHIQSARNLVKGNTFAAAVSTKMYAIYLGSSSSECLVDGNIGRNYTGLAGGGNMIGDAGTNNWATVGSNQTSNMNL